MLSSLRGWLGLAGRLNDIAAEIRRVGKVSAEVKGLASSVHADVSHVNAEVTALREEVKKLKAEVHERLLQYHLQLGRLAPSGGGRASRRPLSGRSLPLEVTLAQRLEWEPVTDDAPDPDGRLWLELDRCPACQSGEWTIVNEWNKLLLLPKAPDANAVRYDYSVCHRCGLLFARRRPCGARYRYLLEHFGEVTAKRGADGAITNPLLDPSPLTDADRERLRTLAARGVFVSDHLRVRKTDYVPGLLRDRFENSIHLDVIASLVAPPRGVRVLEIRSRAGTILDGLRRMCQAQVYAMPIWESQQFLLREVYGIETSDLIDFDRFSIPFDGTFDIIIAQHMLTHVVRLDEFFAEIRRRLRPGGHLYLHNEPDDAEFLDGKQSMIATLNPLHFQAFDRASLERVLAANGFQVVFIKARGDLKHMCLAKFEGQVPWTPMSDRQRTTRIRAYQAARDRAILGLKENMRERVASEWPAAVERGVAEGLVEFDEGGRLRIVAR